MHDTTQFRESQYGWSPKLDAHLEVVEGLLTGDQDFVQVDFRETKNLAITILKDLCYSIDLFYRIINRINIIREAFINVLADFSVKGVPPPPTPLTENQWEKKKVFFLSGKGGYPLPPLNGKSAKLFREFFS